MIAVLTCPQVCFAAEFGGELSAQSAILIEAESGTVLYEKNADERRFPASVTKVMTMLLAMEAMDRTLFGASVCVLGYGRIAKALLPMLL